MEAQVPLLTFQELQEAGPKLREACRVWGCFRLVQHGVPSELMSEMKTATIELFERSLEVKKRIIEVAPFTGFRPPTERSPCYEGFVLHNATPQCIASFCSDLETSAKQREIIETYAQATSKLATDVASKVALSLGVASYDFEDWVNELRVNMYAMTEERRGSFGASVHTDDSFVTILQDDENLGGLQVSNPSGKYVDVAPVPYSFFVNIGDTAMAWSNGELHNVRHCVLCKDVGKRLSIATFLLPPEDKIIQPQAHFVTAEKGPLFAPFTYTKLRAIRAEKKLSVGEALHLAGMEDKTVI